MGAQIDRRSNDATQQLTQLQLLSLNTANFIRFDTHRDLLDVVDKLRSLGVSHYVDLPQIIVCGSQSSGKSSTLESLSGIAFPTSEGLCTRFATELILRRGETTNINVHINPATGRTEKERVRLAAFSQKARDRHDIGHIIESAKTAMGLVGEGAKIFTTDVLRIELTSPDQPNLTIVDLPGLFGASDRNQSDEDLQMVQDLVTGYMKQTRSIILAVVAADNAFANQPVTKFARDIDPQGTRTLGLITKPDKIDQGSESEQYYLELAQNQNVKLTLGWHVLRNKGFDTINDTPEQRDEREKGFFAASAWNCLEPSQLGVGALRERLRAVLDNQIRRGLPGVKTDVQVGMQDTQARLERLGASRDLIKEKRKYLIHISSRLTKLLRAAIDGVYADHFFASYPGQVDAFDRRLRACVQRILTQYSEKMTTKGHALEIVEDDLKPERSQSHQYAYRESYMITVKAMMEECRARELPGTYNPMVVGDLFSRQCSPWKAISQGMVELIHEAAMRTITKLLAEICDENTKTRLMKGVVQPSLHKLRQDLQDQLNRFLEPHTSVHPISYNADLVKEVQEIQYQRHKRKFDYMAKKVCGYDTNTARAEDENVDLSKLLNILLETTKPDVQAYSASLALDVSEAYYKVALKKFVDDLSVNAVETYLIQRLPDVFSPEVVWDLDDAQIEVLGAEDDTTIKSRAEYQEKLRILEDGLKELDTFTTRPELFSVLNPSS